MNRRVAIVGGGLSGLSAAFDLAQAGIAFDLFEADQRFGGMLRSSRRQGFLIEHGADSWIARKPAVEMLARELGMAHEVVASPVISPSTSILRAGRLIPLPAGMRLFIPADLSAAAASPLFSAATKRRWQEELEFPPTETIADESIAGLVERHFGREMLDAVAAPLLAGVYGGDAGKLSARAVIPGIVALEQKHGSLIRGAQTAFAKRAASTGVFRTLREGMESIIAALLAHLPAHGLHLRSAVTQVSAANSGYSLSENGTIHEFSDVIFAVQIPTVSHLLGIDLPAFAYSSAITVALAYDTRPQLPPGFGFLVASGESAEVMAATFVQQKWPHRVPPGKALLRAFIGRPEMMRCSDQAIVAAVRADFLRILGIRAEPLFACVDRWPHSMPQYHLGHREKIAALQTRLAESFPGVHLAGNSLDGVGMPDAVRTGRAAAAAVLSSPQK